MTLSKSRHLLRSSVKPRLLPSHLQRVAARRQPRLRHLVQLQRQRQQQPRRLHSQQPPLPRYHLRRMASMVLLLNRQKRKGRKHFTRRTKLVSCIQFMWRSS